MESYQDYYQVLDVGYNASSEDVKLAYRQLAKRYHPDANAGDKDKEEMFKLISEAYNVLSNTDKKASYDLSLLLGLYEDEKSRTTRTTRARTQPQYTYRPPVSVYYSKLTYVGMTVLVLALVASILLVPFALSRYSSSYHYDKGLEYYQNEQYYAALNSLERSILDFGSKNVEACLLAGTILSEEYGQFNYAIDYMDRGLEVASSDGERVQLLYCKGQYLQGSGDYNGAIEQLNQALELWPQYDSLYLTIASIYAFNLDQYDNAIEYYKQLQTGGEVYDEVTYGLAYCYYKLGDVDQSARYINKYMVNYGISTEAYLLRAKLNAKRGE
ncbi:J domain-containing protein [Tunicatimonas pelagia]|uniref:J domain-containing protein n=1 Tax=Tunicatimonas pelagia TaxID=931531 RepID=UPI0026656E5E|nr:DnaJ domain-containing protein [Tunicatimonas pelagia]WKN41581.1 DnaJ domain-containing protein [Tunicatimonas pelagia]